MANANTAEKLNKNNGTPEVKEAKEMKKSSKLMNPANEMKQNASFAEWKEKREARRGDEEVPETVTDTEKKKVAKADSEQMYTKAKSKKVEEAEEWHDADLIEKKKRGPKSVEEKVAKLPAEVQKRIGELYAELQTLLKDTAGPSKASQMRALQAQGMSVGEISKILNIPYRQVYSTLNSHKYNKKNKQSAKIVEAEAPTK